MMDLFSFNAQSVAPYLISSAGNYSSTPAGSVAWSIGEPVIDTHIGMWILTKGFHQPKSVLVTSLNDNTELPGNVIAFPSPANDIVQLDFSKMEKGEYAIEIYDIAGKILESYKIHVTSETHKETLNLQDYSEGFYVFKITNTSNSKTKNFRLLKQK